MVWQLQYFRSEEEAALTCTSVVPLHQLLSGRFFIKIVGMLCIIIPIAYLVSILLNKISDKLPLKSFLISYAALVKLPGEDW